MVKEKILLASASPRRREILETAGIPFEVVPSFGEEICPAGLSVEEVVLANARAKALEVSSRFPGRVVLGADTLVEYGGEKLGKPKDRTHAAEMLRFLSGKTHRVLTGVCITDGKTVKGEVSVSHVTFRKLSEELIDAYVATGECDDKAGAYGIQGKGCILVEKIQGDYFSIVGLPICTVYKLLEAF